jgi:hypothetical protein
MYCTDFKGKSSPSPCPASFCGGQAESARGAPIQFVASIPGLEVIEPDTILKRNLAAAEYARACQVEAEHGAKDMDDMGDYAVAHPEVVR